MAFEVAIVIFGVLACDIAKPVVEVGDLYTASSGGLDSMAAAAGG